jgi:LysM repeat protein
MWTKSACVVLAWGILLTLVAVGMRGSVRPAQANIRIASGTTNVTLTSTLNVAAAFVKATNPAVRYVVQPGDTLSGIAAALAVRGGWPALYAANRHVIGPDPNTIHPGTVLIVARPATPASPSAGPSRRAHPAPPPAPARTRHGAAAVRTSAPAPAGMPRWLATMLLAVGLLIGAAFLAELVLVAVRRHRHRHRLPATRREPFTGWGPRIIMADYDRLVVTHSKSDNTVYVLRPPGEDPRAILRVARLVLKEDRYQELAAKLGVSANWPME